MLISLNKLVCPTSLNDLGIFIEKIRTATAKYQRNLELNSKEFHYNFLDENINYIEIINNVCDRKHKQIASYYVYHQKGNWEYFNELEGKNCNLKSTKGIYTDGTCFLRNNKKCLQREIFRIPPECMTLNSIELVMVFINEFEETNNKLSVLLKVIEEIKQMMSLRYKFLINNKVDHSCLIFVDF